MPYKNPDDGRKYYLNNKEKINARKKAYYQENREKFDAISKGWNRKNRNKRNAMNKSWRDRNPARIAFLCSKHRALKRMVTVGDLTEIAKVYERAKWWKQWFNVQVDHVIPLTKNGTHEASNLQIIYEHENKSKHNHLGYKPRVVFL